ncbi:MAG TPA: DUF192 domain-containing protein [Acidimicrobiales bacterium]|nr:DUF192 domain-containing protein [Acidimicrobiales bacterium]
MAWLLRSGQVLASVELASSPLERARGFIGRADARCAVLLRPSRTAHTLGVRVPLDVAFLDEHLVVLATVRMAPFRLGLPRRGAAAVLEVPAGAFERWGLVPGDRLEVRG